MTELVLLGVVALLGLLLAFNELRHAIERKHWDTERRQYVATALAGQASAQAASAVIRPSPDRGIPVVRPSQLDL